MLRRANKQTEQTEQSTQSDDFQIDGKYLLITQDYKNYTGL